MPTWSPRDIADARKTHGSDLTNPLDIETACSNIYETFQRHADMLVAQAAAGCDVAGKDEFMAEWELLKRREQSRTPELQRKCRAGAQCAPYIGRPVRPVPFDSVYASLAKIPTHKGEFETTEAFRSRLDSAKSKLQPEYVVAMNLDLDQVLYYADTGLVHLDAVLFKERTYRCIVYRN